MNIRIALIGFGSMGKNYARMLYAGMAEGLTLTGVCCRNAAGQALLLSEFPGVTVYKSIDEMELHSGDFDAVLIVTPHTSHVELGLRMAKLGKHLLMDKPAGISAGEVRELTSLCQSRGLSFAMMFNNRMLPAFRAAHDCIHSGKLGALHRAVWVCNSWYRPPVYHRSAPWRSSWTGEGGGLLINQNQHYLDIWQWLFGMPDKLYADVGFGRYNDFSVDDAVDIQFSYASGFHGTMISATGEAPGVNRLEIWGENGKLTVEDGKTACFDENQVSTTLFGQTCDHGFASIPHTPRPLELEQAANPYILVFENFARHLLYGEPLCADGMDGLQALELTNAAYVSGWEECRVNVPTADSRFLAALEKARNQEASLKEETP